MLSNHLVLCQPLLLLLSIFPSIRIIQLNYKFQFDFLFIFLIKHLPYHAHLEKETATHSSTLAWKIPWTEEPGRLQSVGSWRAGHDWATSVSVSLSLSCIGEGNSNPLQCCCLKNPRDEGAWWAAIYGIAQSWTRLNDWGDLVAAVSYPLKYCFPLSFQSPHCSEFYLWILDFFTSKGLCSFYFLLIMGPYYWRCYVLLFIYI